MKFKEAYYINVPLKLLAFKILFDNIHIYIQFSQYVFCLQLLIYIYISEPTVMPHPKQKTLTQENILNLRDNSVSFFTSGNGIYIFRIFFKVPIKM